MSVYQTFLKLGSSSLLLTPFSYTLFPPSLPPPTYTSTFVVFYSKGVHEHAWSFQSISLFCLQATGYRLQSSEVVHSTCQLFDLHISKKIDWTLGPRFSRSWPKCGPACCKPNLSRRRRGLMGLPAWDRVLLCSVLATNPNHKNQTCILLHACMHDIVFATCPVLGTLAAQINVIHEDKILQAPPWSQWRRKRRKWKRMRSHWPAATDLTLKGPQILKQLLSRTWRPLMPWGCCGLHYQRHLGRFALKGSGSDWCEKNFARSRVRIAANIGSKTILVSLATTSAFHHPLYVQDSYQTVRPALLPQLLDIS